MKTWSEYYPGTWVQFSDLLWGNPWIMDLILHWFWTQNRQQQKHEQKVRQQAKEAEGEGTRAARAPEAAKEVTERNEKEKRAQWMDVIMGGQN